MIVIDFETKSPVDIELHGNMIYTHHPETDVLMMAYKINDQPTQQWFPDMPVPDFEDDTIYAFNFEFELAIWNNVCTRYGFRSITAEQMMDVQAICARYGLPQNLENAAKVLRVLTQKDTFGKRLIKLFCTPPYGRDSNGNILPTLKDQWNMFCLYNIHDVDATYQVLKALPSDTLNESERKIWLLNHEINVRGIPVAVNEAKQIKRVTEAFLDEHNDRLPYLTNGAVEKVTQVKRIKDWMSKLGYNVESLTADELAKWLRRDDLPDNLTEVLEIRAGMGLSSLGKYKRIENEAYQGRMFHNSRYYGAHTGRITGMGLQLLNLPRAKVSDPEAEIDKFFDLSIVYENPVLSARALVRPMIKAPEGKVLMAADFSSIEYILLMWLAQDWNAVERFANKFDPYKDLAVHMYNVPYEEVTKDQRQMGKMGVLGCGYGLGAVGFVRYADTWGVQLPLTQAKSTVKGFRDLYSGVPKVWYALNDCAINACEFPGREFAAYNTVFRYVQDRNGNPWLRMQLPSGRAMFYWNPKVEDGTYGRNVTSWSIDQKTKTWAKKYMTPGKWTENVIQAIGRDLLYHAKMIINKKYPIIFSVYDEVVVEVDEDKADLQDFINCMCSIPSWGKGLPVRADGYISTRYKKD